MANTVIPIKEAHWRCPNCTAYNEYERVKSTFCKKCGGKGVGTLIIGEPGLEVGKAFNDKGITIRLPLVWKRIDGTKPYYRNETTKATTWNWPTLPCGWEENYDSTTEKPYYYNETTKVRTPNWPLPSGWEQKYDSHTKKNYYWNEHIWTQTKIQTDASTWNWPTLPSGWVENYDPVAEKPWYYNTISEKTTWEWPTLPSGWVENYDPVAEKPWYYNTISEKTTWEWPTKPAIHSRRLLHRNPLIDRFIRESLRCQTS